MVKIISEPGCKQFEKRVRRIIKKYDLKLKSKVIHILNDDSIPWYSYGRVFLFTKNKYYSTEISLLALILHEDAHMIYNYSKESKEYNREIYKKLAKLPGVKKAAKDGVHLELCACFVEFQQLKKLVGEEKATCFFKEWGVYPKVRDFILKNQDKLDKIIHT